MDTISELFSKDIERHIEEVIKVDQADAATVRSELDEYIVTDSIQEHFVTVYKAVADACTEPHEGIGIWVSGFFGSGKSSFAKILGYTIAAREVSGTSASELFKQNVQNQTITTYLDQINTAIPTHAVIFDVSMDRGVRTASERITEIMYKALLRELGYSEDFDLAELEISLEGDGLLKQFCEKFQARHGKPWEIRRKLGRAVNEASAALHDLDPNNYTQEDSWARGLGQGRADVTPNLLAERAFELAACRKPKQALVFVIDEVGQYVSRSVDKMLDLQAVVQAIGKEGKNRVTRRQAVAPFWIIVTSQEKLNEVVTALDSKKVELARLQDRFPTPIDLKQSDIAEITSKRVLAKSPEAEQLLGQRYDEHEGRLKTLTALERTGRDTSISRQEFIELYPYLPYQIDLSIDIVSGLRLRRGAQRHIGGSNRTIILQAQQMLVHPRTRLADEPVGQLVTLDRVYELLYAGNLLPSELTREVDDVPNRLPNDEMAYKVVKAIALMEVVADAPRTPHNLAVVLHPNVEDESLLPKVEAALTALADKQVVRESDEGYKLLTVQEKRWDDTRRGLDPKPAARNRIMRETFKEMFADPRVKKYRFKDLKAIKPSLAVEGEVVDSDGDVRLNVFCAEDSGAFADRCREARTVSGEQREQLFWVLGLIEEIHRLVEELYRSREMVSTHERLAAQGQLSGEESACLADEKVRRDRFQRELRGKLVDVTQSGTGFFQSVQKDASALGQTLPEIIHGFLDYAVPTLYPKIKLGNRHVKGDEAEKLLTAANLNGLPPVFYDDENGLSLVAKEQGRFVPNLGAEICREVLEYLEREHSYGNKVTGKTLDGHFQGIGYGWDPDVLRIVLAVLLRGGAIEVTHQGRKHRNHNDPACRVPFTSKNAFRAASFTPRESLGLKTLTKAARNYEEITGSEVDIEESAIAQAFQKLAAEDRERLLPVVANMNAYDLPGVEAMIEHRQTVDGILDLAADDCVMTLAGEGKSYQEARTAAIRLSEALTEQSLELVRRGRRVLSSQWPVLERQGADEDTAERAAQLREALLSEDFHTKLEGIRQAADALSGKYSEVYLGLHTRRSEVYDEAVNDIKGQPEWSMVFPEADSEPDQQRAILGPVQARVLDEPDLTDDATVCRKCRATIAEMQADIDAASARRSDAIRRLQELATPEQKVERVHVTQILGSVLENPEDVEEAIERFKKHLLKILAEGSRIVLE